MVQFCLQYSWFGISFCSIHGSVLFAVFMVWDILLQHSWFSSFWSIHGLGYPFVAFMVQFSNRSIHGVWISVCNIHGSVLYLNYSWFRMSFWSIHDFFISLCSIHCLLFFLNYWWFWISYLQHSWFWTSFLQHSWFWISIYYIHGYGSLFATFMVLDLYLHQSWFGISIYNSHSSDLLLHRSWFGSLFCSIYGWYHFKVT